MKAKIILSVMACMILLSTGCISNDEDNALAAYKTGIDNRLKAVEASAAQLQAVLQERTATINSFANNLNTAVAKADNTYAKTDTYTQAEINNRIANAIQALKDDQAWIKKAATPVSTGNTGVGTGGTTGNIPQFTPGQVMSAVTTSPDGAVISQVNYYGGNSQIQSSTSASYPMTIWQRLINYNTAIMYVKPTLSLSLSNNLNPYGAFASENVTRLDIQLTTPLSGPVSASGVYAGIPVYQLNATSGGINFYVNPPLGTLTNTVDISPSTGLMTSTGQLQIMPGGYVDISWGISNFFCTPGGIWNISPSCSYHP